MKARSPDEWLELAVKAEAEGQHDLAREFESKAVAAESAPKRHGPKEYQGPSAQRVITLIPRADLPGEEWRDIQGFEGKYQISNFGRMWSLTRRISTVVTEAGIREIGGRFIYGAMRTGPEGTRVAALTKSAGKNIELPLAALVVETFTDAALLPEHRDGNPNNCSLNNLMLRRPSQRGTGSIRKALRPMTVVYRRMKPARPVLDRTQVTKQAEAHDGRRQRRNGSATERQSVALPRLASLGRRLPVYGPGYLDGSRSGDGNSRNHTVDGPVDQACMVWGGL